jgi:hypothetical protein
MELTLALPPQRTTAPILVVSIVLGLLLSPVLERALESWMPAAADTAQQNSGSSDKSGDGSSWDLRSMWY